MIKLPKFNVILGFLANFIVPGLGTIILERYETGIVQLSLTIVCLLMIFVIKSLTIWIIILAALWIWALMSGVKAAKENRKKISRKVYK